MRDSEDWQSFSVPRPPLDACAVSDAMRGTGAALWPTPPVGDSLALFNRLARIEEHLTTLLARTAPKERATPVKTDPDVLAALADLAAVIGVPTKPSARAALKAVVALHGKEKTLQALKATCFAWRNGKACQGSPPHFLAANLIAEAGKRCVATPATRPVDVWRAAAD